MSFQDKKQTNIDQQQTQKNINARLDKMNFKDVDGSTFDSAGTHSDKTISFVTRSSDKIEIYKGDTKISGTGGKKAVMYLKSPHGGIYDETGTYEQPETSSKYGNVSIKKLNPSYGDLVRIPISRYDKYTGTLPSGGSYTGFTNTPANGLWAPKGSSLFVGNFDGTPKQVTIQNLAQNALDDWNMTTQRRLGFKILRSDGNGGYNVEYYLYEISVCGIMPWRMGFYSVNNTGTNYDDSDWNTTKRMIYKVWYKITVERYREILIPVDGGGSYVAADLIESGVYIPDPLCDFGRHTRIPSYMNNLNFYAVRNYNNAAGYNKDFSDSGMIVAFNQTDLDFLFVDVSDITNYAQASLTEGYCRCGYFHDLKPNYTPTTSDMKNVAVMVNWKPRLVLYSEDSLEMYGGGLGNKNGLGYLVDFGYFPGLSHSIVTGEELEDYTLYISHANIACDVIAMPAILAYNIFSKGINDPRSV